MEDYFAAREGLPWKTYFIEGEIVIPALPGYFPEAKTWELVFEADTEEECRAALADHNRFPLTRRFRIIELQEREII